MIVGAGVSLAGAALALATLSLARYRAQGSANATLRAVLSTTGYPAALLAAALLLLAGVVLGAVLG